VRACPSVNFLKRAFLLTILHWLLTPLLQRYFFQVDESEVHQVLTSAYPIAEKKQAMLKQGKSQQEAEEWEALVREVTQVCASKQLVPTVRTQCMRTEFQIPFDATVRASLDTNLCMISERGYDLQNMKVWHRDPSWILKANEITRFPHAVLEIKLELKGGNLAPPKWVSDLQSSGLLYECHKYSKYCHGCAVLLPEDVRSVPYWVDDVSLRESILYSGARHILVDSGVGQGPGTSLSFGDKGSDRQEAASHGTNESVAASKGLAGEKGSNTSGVGSNFRSAVEDVSYDQDGDGGEESCCSWAFPFCSRSNLYADTVLVPTSVQKIEPKVFMANERTFLHWVHHAVILSTIASGILAFSEKKGETWGEWYALALLPVSLGFCLYAMNTFLWRSDQIKARIPARWDDPFGPMILGSIVVLILSINFFSKLYEIAKYEAGEL
jgi:hypothetical protein